VVSSYSKSEWEAYGHVDMTPRGERYEKMEEYMDVCYQLWDSWEPDAIIADKASGIYADPAKVKVINHEGKYFKCKGRHFCAPSPQQRPVIWQAGSSDRGRDFAAKHAEAIFAVHPGVERMRQYADDLNERMERAPAPTSPTRRKSISTRAAPTASCWRRPIRPAASRNSSTW
jgi:alkanesulfonate monooxygenase SsuD/methylene tetrahydromethanopterin reductase-like flavin-dependent oxidoreductase (luciferase family)